MRLLYYYPSEERLNASLVCVSMYVFCILKNGIPTRILTHKSISITKSVAVEIVDERKIRLLVGIVPYAFTR
jgi:hypothetical protein